MLITFLSSVVLFFFWIERVFDSLQKVVNSLVTLLILRVSQVQKKKSKAWMDEEKYVEQYTALTIFYKPIQKKYSSQSEEAPSVRAETKAY